MCHALRRHSSLKSQRIKKWRVIHVASEGLQVYDVVRENNKKWYICRKEDWTERVASRNDCTRFSARRLKQPSSVTINQERDVWLAIHRDVFIPLVINYESRGLSSRKAFVERDTSRGPRRCFAPPEKMAIQQNTRVKPGQKASLPRADTERENGDCRGRMARGGGTRFVKRWR